MEYWIEHADIAINEAGIKGVTPEQLDTIAGVIESAHEFYGQASGDDVANSNFAAHKEREQEDAIKAVQREADIEKNAVERRLKRSREEREALEWRNHDLRRENERLREIT